VRVVQFLGGIFVKSPFFVTKDDVERVSGGVQGAQSSHGTGGGDLKGACESADVFPYIYKVPRESSHKGERTGLAVHTNTHAGGFVYDTLCV